MYLTNVPIIVRFTRTQVNNYRNFSKTGFSDKYSYRGALERCVYCHSTQRKILIVHTCHLSAFQVWTCRGDLKHVSILQVNNHCRFLWRAPHLPTVGGKHTSGMAYIVCKDARLQRPGKKPQVTKVLQIYYTWEHGFLSFVHWGVHQLHYSVCNTFTNAALSIAVHVTHFTLLNFIL